MNLFPRLLAVVVTAAAFHAPTSPRTLAVRPLGLFGPKLTNTDQVVTDTIRMRLRVKSPDGKASYAVGDMDFELFGKTSPNAAGVFKSLAAENAYASTTFHRIIRGFVVQAGEGVETEPYEDDDAGLKLPFGNGALAMSNLGEPNTGNAEFFVTTVSRPSTVYISAFVGASQARADELDGKYVVIGRVAQNSMKVLREVEKYGSTEGDL